MDIQQLKLLAGRTRDLLAQHNHTVTQGQSYDLIAALPGLRNWPEVTAFPGRVDECRLTETTVSRLARRLSKKFGLELASQELLKYLDPLLADEDGILPELWPAGPKPGVYVTTSTEAIKELIFKYEDATDGALLYAEGAGAGSSLSIDLGEYGLWSEGLTRAPSGTLIVVGPLEVAQDEWERTSERMEMACLLAANSGHRVAVLFNTPAPEQIHRDAILLVQSKNPDGDLHEFLKGDVSADGELQVTMPFAGSVPAPLQIANPVPVAELPQEITKAISDALAESPFGILIVGSDLRAESRAELLEAVLPLSDAAGPVVRVMPSMRGG